MTLNFTGNIPGNIYLVTFEDHNLCDYDAALAIATHSHLLEEVIKHSENWPFDVEKNFKEIVELSDISLPESMRGSYSFTDYLTPTGTRYGDCIPTTNHVLNDLEWVKGNVRQPSILHTAADLSLLRFRDTQDRYTNPIYNKAVLAFPIDDIENQPMRCWIIDSPRIAKLVGDATDHNVMPGTLITYSRLVHLG